MIAVSNVLIHYSIKLETTPLRFVFVLLLSISMILGIYREAEIQIQKFSIQTFDRNEIHFFSESFVLGFETWDEARFFSEELGVGGLYISSKNTSGLDSDEVQKRIHELQKNRKRLNLPILWICADQEGGDVSRLSPPLERPIPLSRVGDKREYLSDYLKVLGGGLSHLGINLNLSPVVDLPDKENQPIYDAHSRIESRAISSNKNITSEVGREITSSLLNQGIFSTWKHFPGLGKVTTDTHFFSAELDSSIQVLEEEDIFPYLKLIDSNLPAFIMLSHTRIPSLDRESLASYSGLIVNDYLRSKKGFRYLTITDDFSMGPIYYNGIEMISEMALKGGVDYILISYDKDLIYKVLYPILEKSKLQILDNEVKSEISRSRLRKRRALKLID